MHLTNQSLQVVVVGHGLTPSLGVELGIGIVAAIMNALLGAAVLLLANRVPPARVILPKGHSW